MALRCLDLTENDKGRMVVYQQGTGQERQTDEGVVVSWNESFVFVRYKGDIGSKATYPEDLSFSIK